MISCVWGADDREMRAGFTVIRLRRGICEERTEFGGSWMRRYAEVTLAITKRDRTEFLTRDRMLLDEEERIRQFFRAIGLWRLGEPLRAEWNRVLGASGACALRCGTCAGAGEGCCVREYLPKGEGLNLPFWRAAGLRSVGRAEGI